MRVSRRRSLVVRPLLSLGAVICFAAGLVALDAEPAHAGDCTTQSWPSANGSQCVKLDPLSLARPMTTAQGPLNSGKPSGWVKSASPTVADLDGDGDLEVIVGSLDGKYYIFRPDGTRFPGWPRYTDAYGHGAQPVSSPAAVGDVDGDGQPEIVGASENGWVFVWNTDGTLVPGWPQFTGWNGAYPWGCGLHVCTGVWAGPRLADIDADRKLDVVVGSWSHLLWVWNGAGQPLPGFPRDVWDGIASTAAIDDLDGDGNLDIVFGSDTEYDCDNCQPYGVLKKGGKIHAMRLDGKEMWGWPRHVDAFAWSSPAITDVNNDGHKDVVVGVGLWHGGFAPGPPGNSVTAYDRYGGTIWRFTTVNSVISSPAVADLDGDGRKEVAFGDISGWLYLVDGITGAEKWRRKATNPPVSTYYNSPVFGDVTGDGIAEIVMADSHSAVVRGWDVNGNHVWTHPGGAGLNIGFFTTPTLADLDQSGKTWVVLGGALANGPSTATPELIAGQGSVWAFKTNGEASAIKWANTHQQPVGTVPSVKAFSTGFGGGVEVASLNVDADPRDEIVVGAGPGGGPHVRVVDPETAQEQAGFLAYGPTFAGGVFVATGSFTGPGQREIVVGPGPGGGPNVRVFDWNASGPNPVPKRSFLAYGATFGGGVHVGAADVDGNGVDEIVTGPGPGGGPHVKVFSVAGGGVAGVAEAFPYGAFYGGVRVAGGDYLDAGAEQIVTTPGPGGGPDMRLLRVNTAGAPWVFQPVTSWLAAGVTFTGGIVPGTLARPGRDKVLTGPGRGGGPDLRTVGVNGSGPYTPVLEQTGLIAPPFFTYGLRPAGGDVNGDGTAERLVTQGPGGLPTVRWLP